MTTVLDIDNRGRITIPRKWREKLSSKQVIAIQSKNGILLVPISDNPLNVLKGAFTTSKTTEELKNEALKLAFEEASSGSRRKE